MRSACSHAEIGGQRYVAEVDVEMVIRRLIVHIYTQLIRLDAVLLSYGLQRKGSVTL